MKITLLLVGKTRSDYIEEGISLYLSRLTHYIPFEIKVLPDVRLPRGADSERQKTVEGENFLKEFTGRDTVILLDERGKEYTSREFSVFIDRMMSTVRDRLIFVVGGPYGFSQAVYDRADGKISLSRMTFSHEMIRLFFVEQIYRAMTILRGEPYHHD